jgi:hypothetical protein
MSRLFFTVKRRSQNVRPILRRLPRQQHLPGGCEAKPSHGGIDDVYSYLVAVKEVLSIVNQKQDV